MNQADLYLKGIIQKYAAHDISAYNSSILILKQHLIQWASTCHLETINSGSRAKGTAISLASDVDYLVSLSNTCNDNKGGGLKGIYNELYGVLSFHYSSVRKQNVSIRVKIGALEIDVTPAKKQAGNTNVHSLYLSKLDSWRQTNVQKHINDISQSGRLNEIKILKIWRELNNLDIPSIYLEYLLVDVILSGKYKGDDYLASNVWFAFEELAKPNSNPLFARIVDPANSTNILSDLLTVTEKNRIVAQAKIARAQANWETIVW
jgi:hypothetical protein